MFLPSSTRRRRVDGVEVEAWSVALSPDEREMLVRTGSHPAQQVRRGRILLELDESDPQHEGPVPGQRVIAQRAGVHVATVLTT